MSNTQVKIEAELEQCNRLLEKIQYIFNSVGNKFNNCKDWSQSLSHK